MTTDAEHLEQYIADGMVASDARLAAADALRRLGHANSLGVAIVVHREGDEAVARVTLSPAFEGAPGRAHGGTVAGIFDDVLGNVLTIIEQPAFTGELTVRYLAPTPLGVELEFRGRLVRREDRKLWIEGVCTSPDGTRVAEAAGLFIAIDFSKLGGSGDGG